MKKTDISVSKLQQQVARSENDARCVAADRNRVSGSVDRVASHISTPRLDRGSKAWVNSQDLLPELTICKSQRHFVSAAAAILKGVSLGLNLTQSRCGCTVVCQSFGRTAMFCKNWEIVGSLSCDTWLSLSIAKVRNKRK